MFETVSLAPFRGEAFPEGLLKLDYRSGVDGRRDWALILLGRSRDWAVVLHGHGSHGDQLYVRDDIREAWLPAFRRSGMGVLTPNLRDNAWMNPAAVADLHDLIRWLTTEYGAERRLFTSGSMGGTGNLIYASFHPEDVDAAVARGAAVDLAAYYDWLLRHGGAIQREIAAAIAASYGGRPEEQPELYQRHSVIRHTAALTMPVALLHGGADEIMPASEARRFALAMAPQHPDFHYLEIPGGDHDAPLTAAADLNFPLSGNTLPDA